MRDAAPGGTLRCVLLLKYRSMDLVTLALQVDISSNAALWLIYQELRAHACYIACVARPVWFFEPIGPVEWSLRLIVPGPVQQGRIIIRYFLSLTATNLDLVSWRWMLSASRKIEIIE